MKIISKYKDYYDYLTGIYGVDPKIVLDRRKGKRYIKEDFSPPNNHRLEFPDPSDRYCPVWVYLCGEMYFGVRDKMDGSIFWTEEAISKNTLLEFKTYSELNWNEKRNVSDNNYEYPPLGTKFVTLNNDNFSIRSKYGYYITAPVGVSKYVGDNIHLKYNNCPILIDLGRTEYNAELDEYTSIEEWPQLESIGFGSILSPNEIYQKLYNWMSAKNEPTLVDTQDNNLKIQNAGFDIKTSFRPNMKK